jgi:hypothetical protein
LRLGKWKVSLIAANRFSEWHVISLAGHKAWVAKSG